MDFLTLSLILILAAMLGTLLYLVSKLVRARELAAAASLLKAERDELKARLAAAEELRHAAEKQAALAEQRVTELKARMEDWESQRAESVKTAKAAILEAGSQMSNKLLEDHKREQEAAKKEQEERVQKTTATLLEQVSTLGKAFASLKDDSEKTGQQVQSVLRSLSSPSTAGQLAEFGLENALKNLGLEPNRDFIMQHSVAGHGGEGHLRPDAILFLPNEMVMVVDCKASKFLLELAEAEGTGREAEVQAKLVQTMRKHISDLASKDYASAVLEAFRAQGHGNRIGHMFNVMYLPSESAWEKLRAADAECQQRLEKADLIPASPSTLMGLFSLAKLNIAEARKANNQHLIMEAASGLLESVSVMVGHMDKIGRGISSAMDAFNSVAKSTNTRIIPRMKKMAAMGVKPSKNKELPSPVMSYDLRRLDDMTLIEGEAEMVEESSPRLAASPATADAE